MLISNDYELEMIRKANGWDTDQILQHTGAIITTLGEKGSVVRTRDAVTAVPAATADAVKDPTGAGDAYRAGLIKGMIQGRDLVAAARVGATCASFAVEVSGTQAHRFTPEAFRARHAACFGG
jgi:adenosine kinase